MHSLTGWLLTFWHEAHLPPIPATSTKKRLLVRDGRPVLCNQVLTYPLLPASVCRLLTIILDFKGVHDTLRLILFVSTGWGHPVFAV